MALSGGSPAAQLGRHAEARSLAADDVHRAQSFGAARAIGIALRADALVGPLADRVDGLASALAVLASSPARLEHARVLLDLGATLRAAGQRTAAREPLLRRSSLPPAAAPEPWSAAPGPSSP